MVSPFTVHPFQNVLWHDSASVASADTTALAETFQDNETGHFFVEVRVDQMKVQGTETVRGDRMLTWNEVFLLYVWIAMVIAY